MDEGAVTFGWQGLKRGLWPLGLFALVEVIFAVVIREYLWAIMMSIQTFVALVYVFAIANTEFYPGLSPYYIVQLGLILWMAFDWLTNLHNFFNCTYRFCEIEVRADIFHVFWFLESFVVGLGILMAAITRGLLSADMRGNARLKREVVRQKTNQELIEEQIRDMIDKAVEKRFESLNNK